MSYDKELIIHKLERWDRFITITICRTGISSPIWDSTWIRWWCCWCSISASSCPSPAARELRHLLRHQQLCAPEDHACSGEAEVLPGNNPPPLIITHPKKRPTHQDLAENFAPRQKGLRVVCQKFLPKIPLPSNRRHRHPPPSGNEEGGRGAAGHRVRTHRRVLQNSGGEADPPVRRRYGGRSGRRAAP